MRLLVGIFSVASILLVFLDAFEAMVLPRRITHPYRLARLYFRAAWNIWRRGAPLWRSNRYRLAYLGIFGPLAVLGLFLLWVVILLVAFGMLHWARQSPLTISGSSPQAVGKYLYFSGVTFFTLGYGDVVPADDVGRVLAVFEAGTGLGFLAVIIGYMPVLYQSFSSRERAVGLLDARAGSPPTATEFLLRVARNCRLEKTEPFLLEWERWSAEVLESHLSFPVLSYYRSQHDNQSWVAALTMILDGCALLLTVLEGVDKYHVQLTFAMARHVAVDLSLIFWIPPVLDGEDRLPPDRLAELLDKLREVGAPLAPTDGMAERLARLRRMYEPFVLGLSRQLLMDVPGFLPPKTVVDNWQTSAWMKRTPGINSLPNPQDDEHFI